MPSANPTRSRLDHPVIDADGHLIEFMPAVRDHMLDVGGRKLVEEFDASMAGAEQARELSDDAKRALGMWKMTWWAFPTRNSLDRATGMLPKLFYERLDELGLDFAVVYPTLGLMPMSLDQTDLLWLNNGDGTFTEASAAAGQHR